MWATLLQICCLIQWLRGALMSVLVQRNSDLNSMLLVGSSITRADFSKNFIREVRVSSLSEARNLEVRVSR